LFPEYSEGNGKRKKPKALAASSAHLYALRDRPCACWPTQGKATAPFL
jgi:hypothetical protein